METGAFDRRPALPPGPYLVVGLARSGAAVARLLARDGAEVIGVDSGHPAEAGRLAELGVEVHLDGQGIELLDRVQTVVKSPGVPPSAEVIAAARRRGIAVLGEMEVAWRQLDNRFVAVTGTNGKTTVTELIAHLLRSAGEPVQAAGNVGRPLADLVGEAGPDATIVCECSSFQLHDSEAFAPEVAVFLNFSEDHLDWHQTLSAYLGAKLRLFANQAPEDFAVHERAEPAFAGYRRPGDAADFLYCPEPGAGEGCRLALDEEGNIAFDGEVLIGRSELPLRGDHNLRNAMAATAAALASGARAEAIAGGLRDFPPQPHRLEPVAEIAGVLYVNDSKATNPAAAAAALRAFERPIRVIMGGSLKGGGFGELVEPVGEHCASVHLIGEAAEALAADLAGVSEHGVAVHRRDDLADAVRAASVEALAGDVVLLAPACASFDAFADYVERGRRFSQLVEELR